jgi:hypothetical protein
MTYEVSGKIRGKNFLGFNHLPCGEGNVWKLLQE